MLIKFKDGTEREIEVLRYANLRDANLSGADLRDANLSDAKLSGANLADAGLPEGFRIARLDFGGWPVTVMPTRTTIGCREHANEDWLKWSPFDVAHMADGAEAWWTRHGAAVCAVIRDVMQCCPRC